MFEGLTRGLTGAAIAVGITAGLGGVAQAADITGAGATFPYPVYAKWAAAYKAKTGVGLNYQSIGSGGGIKQISAKTVDFGASDAPLSGKRLAKIGLTQFPTVMGGVVPVYHLPGIKAGAIKFTGPLIADIFMGKVKKWNDPAIAKINPGVKLPNRAISVVHRSDGSGTTYIFTNYLSKVSAAWKKSVGNAKAVSWPTGIGGKGNEGVAAFVQKAVGSIGYVEYAYALQNKLTYGLLRNKAGHYVAPTAAAFMAAAASANWKAKPGFGIMLTNQPGAKAWPISGATFILMYKKQAHPKRALEVLKFFNWSYQNGDKLAMGLDYVPMPNSVVKQIQASWAKNIKDMNGKPIWKPMMH
jgi:phosphate transport system substrate-binding protein